MRDFAIQQLLGDGSLGFTYPQSRPGYPDQTLVMGANNQVSWGKYRLFKDTTFQVAPLGADVGDGSTANPFGRINYAIKWIRQNVDTAGHQVILQLAAGIYTEDVIIGYFPGRLSIIGNETNPGSCRINAASIAINAIGSFVDVIGVYLSSTDPEGNGLRCEDGILQGSSLILGAIPQISGNSSEQVLSYFNGRIFLSNLTFDGGSTNPLYCGFNSYLSATSINFSRTFSCNSFAYVSLNSYLTVASVANVNITGIKAIVFYNSQFAGANQLPASMSAPIADANSHLIAT